MKGSSGVTPQRHKRRSDVRNCERRGDLFVKGQDPMLAIKSYGPSNAAPRCTESPMRVNSGMTCFIGHCSALYCGDWLVHSIAGSNFIKRDGGFTGVVQSRSSSGEAA